MIIDFHTHVFPDKIAEKTVAYLAEKGEVKPYLNGTKASLADSMKKSGTDISVVLPVVTKPSQFDSINRYALEITGSEGIISFGGIHPDCDDIEEKLDFIKSVGLRGVKLHPDYQDTYADDEKYVRIVRHCRKNGLITVFHSGLDTGYKDHVHCTPDMVLRLMEASKPEVGDDPDYALVLAHGGAAEFWDDVEEKLCGKGWYFDISFIINMIDRDQLVRIIRKNGADHILYGTDSPWADQTRYIADTKALPITESEKDDIFGGNAKKLLKI